MALKLEQNLGCEQRAIAREYPTWKISWIGIQSVISTKKNCGSEREDRRRFGLKSLECIKHANINGKFKQI